MARKSAASLSSEKVRYWFAQSTLWISMYLSKLKVNVRTTYFCNKNEYVNEYLGNINKKALLMMLYILDYSYSRRRLKSYILKSLPFKIWNNDNSSKSSLPLLWGWVSAKNFTDVPVTPNSGLSSSLLLQ